MSVIRFFFLSFCLFLTCSLCSGVEQEVRVQPDRRVLARVRDSVITVADVLKKMDLVFYQQFPQFRSLLKERAKFYEMHWKRVLQDLVERRLMLILAEENHFEISHGDVREELENMFGPNVLLALYEAKVPLDDASEMVRQDIMMRRLFTFYVRSAVLNSVTPQKIRERYEEKYGKEKPQEKISWSILSLKSPEDVDSRAIMAKVIASLNEKTSTLEDQKAALPEKCEITVSPLFITEKSQISTSLRPILEAAEQNQWTSPFQIKDSKSGVLKWVSYRVTGRSLGEKVSLAAVEDEIREELLSPILEERRKSFIDDLMKKYDVSFAMNEKEMDLYIPFRLE